MRWGEKRKLIAETLLKYIRRSVQPARRLRELLKDDYGSFNNREFWRVLKYLREQGIIERIGTFRHTDGGYRRTCPMDPGDLRKCPGEWLCRWCGRTHSSIGMRKKPSKRKRIYQPKARTASQKQQLYSDCFSKAA